MNKATETFENYIDFWVNHKPSVADKIMFCIYKGMDGPQALRAKLQIAKGNLTNSCKALAAKGLIVKVNHGRIVRYELTKKGSESVKKFLEALTCHSERSRGISYVSLGRQRSLDCARDDK